MVPVKGATIEGTQVLHHHNLPPPAPPQPPQQQQQDDNLGVFRAAQQPLPQSQSAQQTGIPPSASPAAAQLPPVPQTVRPGRRPPPPGPGFYHRTLSSSSLFSNKCAQVAKSRSEYCGINQVCGSAHGGATTGSNYDFLLGQYNANLNPNLRNNLSRSGNIVYRCGGGIGVSPSAQAAAAAAAGVVIPSPSSQLPSGGGISFVDTSILEVDGNNALPGQQPQPTPPPPERRHLVRGLSRNAFINLPQYAPQPLQPQDSVQQHQQQQQYYWQLPPHQQHPSYPMNSSFEQQYQFQQQFLSKVQRRGVAGSQPDISRCTVGNLNNSSGVNPASLAMTPSSPYPHISPGGGGMMGGPSSASSHQVAIDMPSASATSTSPQTTRRLLPRIITKKTDNSTVVLVGETRTPGMSPFGGAPPTSYPESLSTSYISPGGGSGGGGGWRTNECAPTRNELSSSQILSTSSCAASTTTPKKTESFAGIVHKDHGAAALVAASGGDGSGGPSLSSGTAATTAKTTSSSSHPTSKLSFRRKERKSCGEAAATASAKPSSAVTKDKGVRSVVRLKNVPSYISAHFKNAPIKKLKHPLEENIFSSLFITLFAVAVALIVGVPILCGLGLIVIGVVSVRYLVAIVHGMVSYARFLCSNRQYLANSRALPPHIIPRDRLAFANDVRWLGKKRKSRCQSILHTLLVFEGSMDVATLRHLIQTRVLRAETPEGELAYPRLLQKLVSVTAGWLWELDLTFDIQNHIFSGPTHFKSEEQLQRYIGKLFTQELPLSRPLWEIRLLPSYYGSGKDTMAILRVHQCLADGMSLIRILSHSLADHTLMHVPQRPHFAGMSFGFNLLRSLIVGPLTIFLWWFTTFRDRNLFSVPLPKLRRKQRAKCWRLRFWRNPLRWLRGHGTVVLRSGTNGEEEQENVCFTSSLDSSSGSWSDTDSCDGSDRASTHSNNSNSSGVKKRTRFAHSFRSPVQSVSKDDELTTTSSPRESNSNANTSSRETGGTSNLQEDQGSSKSTKSSNQVLGGILSRSKGNLNTCLGKKLSASKSSMQMSQQDPISGSPKKGKSDKRRVVTSTQGGSSGGKSRRKMNKKKRKKKRRGRGQHSGGHHPQKRRRFLGRKSSFGSNSSGSSFASSTSSSRTTSSFGSSSRPAAWNVVWSAPMTLPKVARIKQIMRSSYNDVLLSAAAGSVRMYLQDQGVPYPGDVQVVIPVDLRNDIASPKQSTRLGCKVSSVLATIPSGIESAIPRLWATRHRLDELKASADSVVAYGATTILMNMLPHRIAIPILESITNKASLQFCNLPGPTATTVIGGYPLKGIYPIFPPPGRLRVSISVLTYADQVHVTVLTHRSLQNAGPKLLKGMTEQVEQLSKQLSARRVPGESRRSTRNFNQANNAEITKPPTRQIQMQLQVVQEELASLNSQLEAQGIVLTEQEYGFISGTIGRRIAAAQQHQGLLIETGGGQYHMQQQQHYHHHHHHSHYHQEQQQQHQSEEPCTSAASSMEMSPAGQIELQNRLKSLKNEFAQLIGELRRRSSIVEGIAMSFEDEEQEEEYRKPRKRALSVVSMTRRSSIFSSRSNTTPDSPVYSSDEELPSSPPTDVRHQTQSSGSGQGATSASSSTAGYPTPTPNIRHTSSPMRTTAV